MNLVEFLRARLDEDEAEIAKHPDDWDDYAEIDAWRLRAEEEGGYPSCRYLRIAKARALAELEMKRLWLSDHDGVHRCEWGEHRGADYLGWCHVVKRLAKPYAAHPDYDEELV